MRLLPLLLALALALAACGESKPSTVDIKAFKYGPATVTVKAGAKVTWVNRDTAGHTATFKDLDTDRLEKGDRKALTFERPGRYPYVCAFHAFMTGEVVVE
jgi:plastocyanin